MLLNKMLIITISTYLYCIIFSIFNLHSDQKNPSILEQLDNKIDIGPISTNKNHYIKSQNFFIDLNEAPTSV